MDYTQRIENIHQKLMKNWDDLKHSTVKADIDKAKHICIFGTGDWFRYVVKNYYPFTSGRLDFVCDNDEKKWGEYFEDVVCISPDELAQYKNEVFVFVAVKNPLPIFEQLKSMGIKNMNVISPWRIEHYDEDLFLDEEWRNNFTKNVANAINVFEDDFSKETFLHILNTRYSVPPEYENYAEIMTMSGGDYFAGTPLSDYLVPERESFVDLGAYTGDSIINFLNAVNNKFHHIYSYELDINNYLKAVENIKLLNETIQRKISIKNIGIGKERGVVRYTSDKEMSRVLSGNQVDSSGIYEGEIQSLDTELGGKPVTLIKMDIEGEEVNALKGAREIIKTQKPKLAISIYHKNADIWEIPLLIKELNPDYKIYIRHQSCICAATICYAIP